MNKRQTGVYNAIDDRLRILIANILDYRMDFNFWENNNKAYEVLVPSLYGSMRSRFVDRLCVHVDGLKRSNKGNT